MTEFRYRDDLKLELMRAISDHQARLVRTTPRAAIGRAGPYRNLAAALIIAVALALAASSIAGSLSSTQRVLDRAAAGRPTGTPSSYPPGGAVTEHAGPPVSLADARTKASFRVYVPNGTFANPDNLAAVYAASHGGEVELDYPQPGPSSSSVRQAFISIWESRAETSDTQATIEGDLDRAYQAGISESFCKVGDLPAICVQPRASSDALHANAAYVRLFRGETEIHISGGDELGALVSIGRSLR